MSEGRRPTLPSNPLTRDGVRVRHRHTRREGRIAPDPAEPGFVRILFDGETRARNVPAAAVEDLDPPAPPRSLP